MHIQFEIDPRYHKDNLQILIVHSYVKGAAIT